jgi:hypothetical protein
VYHGAALLLDLPSPRRQAAALQPFADSLQRQEDEKMFRNRWLILIGVIVVIGVLVWGWRHTSGPGTTIDLIPMLAKAEKRSQPLPVDEAIKVVTVTINGESKPCITEQAFGRITFKLTPPADSWFSASIAVDPSAWDKEGDGVLFRMAVSDGKSTYEELLNQHVNPAQNKSDRRWIPVALDLSAYAGREVNVILSTNPSLPGKVNDLRNDLALWGAPSIVVGK